jgi:hypothetical protein
MANEAVDTDAIRIRQGVRIIFAAFALVFAMGGASMWKWSSPQDVAAVLGAVSGMIGTLVGAFFGVHAGAVGSAQAERARRDAEAARARAELRALRLAGASEPVHAEAVLTAD